ncbi:MAG: hypothetical protein KatS3mg115_0481 [Candidatus Poribacteria bacterium]|nr:MAG: hypothetical protein KatS3mg115_0481 [Candidatus Poribacteria bacterium]
MRPKRIPEDWEAPPSELELLILPYLSGELGPEDRRRVEREMEMNPAFRSEVEEFRQTLAAFQMDVAEADLEGFEEELYRRIVARQRELYGARPVLRRRRVGEGLRRARAGWMGALATAVAGLTVVVFLSAQSASLRPFVPVAQLQVAGEAPALRTAVIHRRIESQELERRLDEAQIAQYLQREPDLALPVYDFIIRRSPDSWASEVAAVERSVLVQTAAEGPAATPLSFQP